MPYFEFDLADFVYLQMIDFSELLGCQDQLKLVVLLPKFDFDATVFSVWDPQLKLQFLSEKNKYVITDGT